MNTSAMKKEEQTLEHAMHAIGEAAREAYRELANATSELKNKALLAAADSIEKNVQLILDANAKDMAAAKEKGLTGPLLDRLLLDEKRIKAMAAGVRAVAKLPDPVGKMMTEWDRPNGLHISRVSVPLGVIGIIYESRPNVTADAGALCIKSGNAAILRGGSESFHSSKAIVTCLHDGLKEAGLSKAAVQLVPTQDREAVGIMLKMVGLIDVIVPRGGLSLTQRVAEESRIPTILHLDGNCHTYLHEKADLEKAVAITFNAKMRRTGICGATESILVDKSVVDTIWPAVAKKLLDEGCEVRADIRAKKADSRIKDASQQDWGTEYLDKIVSVKTVQDVTEAIQHINHYSSHHTDAIITEDSAAAEQFLKGVDSAIVLHNASTQFADGGEFGLGAEIGISTGRLHARGPVGADQLVTYKYVVHGNGQIRPV
ncbi:MAG: glutamate-5-semialdehyde dehydrogenase [Rickettsiales bacterium]